MIKRRPKQDFTINYPVILDSDLRKVQKDILIEVLMHHKNHCKYEYVTLYNTAIFKKLEIGKDSFAKHRKALIDNNYIELKKVRSGKAMLIQYRFNWTKLLKLKFILPTAPSEYKPVTKRKKQSFKKGQVLVKSDIQKILDSKLYTVKEYRLDASGNQIGNGKSYKRYGNDLKKIINVITNTNDKQLVFVNSE